MAPLTFSHANAASQAGVQLRSDRLHPAVARIVVPEQGGATSYGSGTLIDVRDNFGLVITNWHVVRDAEGTIEVKFPGGFTSKARALKVDSDWDLAALVIWRPNIEPVSIALEAPQPGDPLMICGYGSGDYRAATGRCTQYYAPRLDFPRHMVELDVEARQGDSGGPIFNRQGELAGVLFGAGQGTTLGSFGGRVGAFLATLAPDIGRAEQSLADQAEQPGEGADEACWAEATPACRAPLQSPADALQSNLSPSDPFPADPSPAANQRTAQAARLTPIPPQTAGWPAETLADSPTQTAVAGFAPSSGTAWQPVVRDNLFEQVKTVLAAIGLLTLVVQVLRVAG